jgi:hypothetical protein
VDEPFLKGSLQDAGVIFEKGSQPIIIDICLTIRDYLFEISVPDKDFILQKFTYLFKRANYSKQLISERFILFIIGTFDDIMCDFVDIHTESINKLIKELISLREETSDVIRDRVDIVLIKFMKLIDLTNLIISLVFLSNKSKQFSIDCRRLFFTVLRSLEFNKVSLGKIKVSKIIESMPHKDLKPIEKTLLTFLIRSKLYDFERLKTWTAAKEIKPLSNSRLLIARGKRSNNLSNCSINDPRAEQKKHKAYIKDPTYGKLLKEYIDGDKNRFGVIKQLTLNQLTEFKYLPSKTDPDAKRFAVPDHLLRKGYRRQANVGHEAWREVYGEKLAEMDTETFTAILTQPERDSPFESGVDYQPPLTKKETQLIASMASKNSGRRVTESLLADIDANGDINCENFDKIADIGGKEWKFGQDPNLDYGERETFGSSDNYCVRVTYPETRGGSGED